MIIDFHSHVFPGELADRAIKKLSVNANIKNYTNGTDAALISSMKRAGVDLSVVLPVATKPTQTADINRIAAKKCKTACETHILSFGSIHPDNENYREILDFLVQNGVKGIKIHPVFAKVRINDIRYERIISCASQKGLIVITHAGYDVGYPGVDCANPCFIKEMLRDVKPQKFVLAHMGGWGLWNEVIERFYDEDIYIDTSFSINPLRPGIFSPGRPHSADEQLDDALFLELVRTIGAGRVLFGTDSPWSDQAESINCIRRSGLTVPEQKAILGENAKTLLGLSV